MKNVCISCTYINTSLVLIIIYMYRHKTISTLYINALTKGGSLTMGYFDKFDNFDIGLLNKYKKT
jgi:hypothetical protein